MHIITLSLLLFSICCGPVLDNIPIIFQMTGSTTYSPDRGGSTQTGYMLKIGYSYKQWLGIQFVSDINQNDVIIMQIDDFYTTGSTSLFTGHEVTFADYYETDGTLNVDQSIEKDISAYSYVQTKHYEIDMIRYVGSNSNQDWNGVTNQYSLTQVCFYTSDSIFDNENWNQYLKQCYFFEINNYISTFKGVQLKTFYLNGYQTGIYGWIDGPYVTDNVYFYHTTPLFAYVEEPAFAIEFGTTSGKKGQDFHVFSPIAGESGDYFGSEVTNMTKDNTMTGGFENGGLTASFWNADPADQINEYGYTTLRATFSRNISTYDDYDRELKSTFVFCLYLFAEGTINSDLTDKGCEIVQLSYHYPRMKIPERSGQYNLRLTILGITAVCILLS